MAGIIDLSNWQVAIALALVLAIVIVSVRQSLGLERDLAIGTVRTIVQLYAVGLILSAVFAAARWYWVLLILGVMTPRPRLDRCSSCDWPLVAISRPADQLQRYLL